MSKVYQPMVIKEAEEIIQELELSGFFKDYEITNMEFVKEYMCDVLTEKFIEGGNIGEQLFSEQEFGEILRDLINGNTLHNLVEKGVLFSYEDEEKGEIFGLTKAGREYVKENLEKQKKQDQAEGDEVVDGD